MTTIKTAMMLATLPLTMTALLAGTALADRGEALVCGADDDRSLVCFYDASTSPDALSLERCDDADTRRPVCASVELDLTAPDPGASLIWPWDQADDKSSREVAHRSRLFERQLRQVISVNYSCR